MFVNASEICAARKLLECREFGTDMNDVSRKFPGNRLPDLPDDHFEERKRVAKDVERWVADHAGKEPELIYRNNWTPILYNFEVRQGPFTTIMICVSNHWLSAAC